MTADNDINQKTVKLLKSKWIRLIFALLIIVSIVYYINNIDQDLRTIFLLTQPKYILFAIPFVLFSLMAHGIAWRLIINHYGYDLGVIKSIYVYYLSNLSRYIPGNYWYIVLRSTIGVKYGIDLKTGFKVTGIEMFMNSLIGFLFIVLGLFLNVIRLDHQQMVWLAIFFIVSVILMLFLYINERRVRSSPFTQKQSKPIFSVIKEEIAQLWTFKPWEIVRLGFWYSSAWISQGLCFFLILSIWNDVGIANYFIIMFSYVTAWFMGFINPLAQSGIGVREAVFVITIGRLFPVPIILGASIGMRLLGLFGELLLVLVGWLKVRNDTDDSEHSTTEIS